MLKRLFGINLQRARFTSTPRRLDITKDIDKCSGCGAVFHENKQFDAGYLPDLQHRKEAFIANLDYSFYMRTVLDIKPHSLLKYEEKKTRERLALPAAQDIELPPDVENSKSWARMYTGNDNVDTTKLPPEAHRHEYGLVCARCHSLTFHQRLPSADPLHDSENQQKAAAVYQSIEDKISASPNGFIVCIGDILDFPSSLHVSLLKKFSTQCPIVVLINKVDLLPERSNMQRISHYLDTYLKDVLKITNLVGCYPVSLKNNVGLDPVVNAIVRHKSALDDIFILGTTNVGKSTFINALLKKFDGPKDRMATTSWQPGTTIDMISIPLKKFPLIRDFILKSRKELVAEKKPAKLISPFAPDSFVGKSSEISKLLSGNIIDTPGLPRCDQPVSYLTQDELKFTVVSNPFKPSVYFLTPGRSMWLGGLGRLDFVEGKAQVLATVYTSPKIPIHFSSIQKAEWLWNVHGGGKSKLWHESLHVDKRKLLGGYMDVEKKNDNKDLWAGIKLVPPLFTSPKRYIESLAEIETSDDDEEKRQPSGLLFERIKAFPRWKLAIEHTFTRDKPLADHPHSDLHFQQALSDIVIGGVGWVSITGNFERKEDREAKFRVYTPGGGGVTIRTPSLLPFDVLRRGRKVRGHNDGIYKQPSEKDLSKAVAKEEQCWKLEQKRLAK